jgi:hypothetical protein
MSMVTQTIGTRWDRRGEGGFVLVLSMLVIVALSAVGIFALRTSRVELRGAANLRMGSQAEYVAEAAVQVALGRILENPTQVIGALANGQSYTIPYVAGVFGESGSPPQPATFDTFGVTQGVAPQWSVLLSRAIDVSPAALTGTMIGSVGGTTTRFRMKRIDVTATGGVQPQVAPGTQGRTAISQVRAHMVVGPL